MKIYMEDQPYGLCCFHPRESMVGVCAGCLREKLLVVAAKQAHGGAFGRIPSLKPTAAVPKVFAIGTSLFHRLESRHRNQKPGADDNSASGSIPSADDSFISIKFEDNGQICWDKKAAAAAPPVVSFGTRGGVRWRKRVRYFLHLLMWKRPAKAGGDTVRMGSIWGLARKTSTA